MSEAGLTRVMARVSDDLASGRGRKTVVKPDGRSGRADQFLGRIVPGPEQDRHEYLLVELERPGLVVGRKELDQVEDYLNAMRGQPISVTRRPAVTSSLSRPNTTKEWRRGSGSREGLQASRNVATTTRYG